MKRLLATIMLIIFATLTTPFAHASSGLQNLKQSASIERKFVQQVKGLSSTTPGITKTLHRGSSGPQVELLQEFLKRYGTLSADASTGYFGPVTKQAVISFQTKERLEPLGVVGPKTRARIVDISKHTLVSISQTASSTPVIDSALLSTDVGEDGSGVGSATTFATTTPTIYAVLALENTLMTTEIGYIRHYNGAYLDSAVTHQSRNGLRYTHFQWTLKPGMTRNPGQYSITFYIDGKRGPTINYTIQ